MTENDLHLFAENWSWSEIQTGIGLVVGNKTDSEILTFSVKGSEKLTCVNLCGVTRSEMPARVDLCEENGSGTLTYADLCVENVHMNHDSGLEWGVEPCSVSEARLLFLRLVWLQQIAK